MTVSGTSYAGTTAHAPAAKIALDAAYNDAATRLVGGVSVCRTRLGCVENFSYRGFHWSFGWFRLQPFTLLLSMMIVSVLYLQVRAISG